MKWFVFCACLLTAPVTSLHAQFLGIAGLLNPEGSRLFPQTLILPRHAGKPDPRWKSFEWYYTDLSVPGALNAKFRLYFYEEENWIVQFAVPEIRREIEELRALFNYTPTTPFSYLLFNSQREFRQANIFDISEGVQGITSTTEASMAIPYWGDAEAFRHVSTHEMVHQFQVQKIWSLSGGDARSPVFQLLPLWFIEGMAEHYSLRRIDPESETFLRDLHFNPDPKLDYVMPSFFENGPLSFVTIYKVGQAKIDFLETEFGKGTAQKLLEESSKKLGGATSSFEELAASELKKSPADIESLWKNFIEEKLKKGATPLTDGLDTFEVIAEAGENIDHYALSPNEKWIALREVNPLTGTASITLLSLDQRSLKTEIAKDHDPNLLSLFFMQFPSIALTDQSIAYVVDTSAGPELEYRSFSNESQNKITLSQPSRIPLHPHGILQASSPTFSPDDTQIAFIGLNADGWQNLYLLDHQKNSKPKSLTRSLYAWQTLSWNEGSLLASSNQTANGKFNLFQINPSTRKISKLSASAANQFSPEKSDSEISFLSWESGTPQIHSLLSDQEIQLTHSPIALKEPKRRGQTAYALGFRNGRFHLYRIPIDKIRPDKVTETQEKKILLQQAAWQPDLEMASIERNKYTPFVSSRFRTDQILGYFASGNVFGIGASLSDLMRDYSITGEFSVLGTVSMTTLYLFLSVTRGRTTWHTGGFHLVQARLDNLINSDERTRTYLHREFGVLGALQYPLTHYSFFDAEIRLSGVKRSDFSDLKQKPFWDAENPGLELLISPIFRIGYDGIQYELFTGPLTGYGALFEVDTSLYPERGEISERLRLDGSRYFQLTGSAILATQVVAGVSFGEKFGNPFFVSSDDILRAYNFGDDRLRGNYLLASRAELRFPVGTLIGFPPLRGLVGADIGSLSRTFAKLTKNTASAGTLGFSLNVPPLAINFLFSYPLRTAPGPIDRPVVHFTLRYLYL